MTDEKAKRVDLMRGRLIALSDVAILAKITELLAEVPDYDSSITFEWDDGQRTAFQKSDHARATLEALRDEYAAKAKGWSAGKRKPST